MIKGRLIILSLLLLGLSTNKSFAQRSDDTDHVVILDPIPESAEFSGGQEAWQKFIYKNLHPIKGASGKRVFISFIVEKDGTLTHFKVIRGVSKKADEEALRVMRLSPRWKPVRHNGHAERQGYTQPIMFPK